MNEHPHYQPFLESVEKKSTENLDLFKEETFWKSLNEEEKRELVNLFLKRAAEAIEENNESKLSDSSKYAEEISDNPSEVIVRLSQIFLSHGIFHRNKESLLQGLDKMVLLEEKNPAFFVLHPKTDRLWGNLLLALHRIDGDESFLEQAIEKYERGLSGLEKKSESEWAQMQWDLGEAYLLLGKRSKELGDLKKSEMAFAKASSVDLGIPHFWLDYSETLFYLGLQLGDPDYFRKANEFYTSVIAKIGNDKRAQTAYMRAWVLYALSSQKIVEYTHDEEEFLAADRVFQEAITAVPGESALWLHWGELFLRFGWYQKDLNYLDKGLEKLTALKTSECDPLALSVLLSEGLVLLGICIEDLRLIKEGEKRIQLALTDGHESLELLIAAGICAFAKGHYFGEEKSYVEAFNYFEKVLEHDTNSLFARHLIFESGMALADLKGESHFAKKSIEAIGRAATLAPKVPLFWNEWGIALVKWHVFEKKPTLLLEQAVEKFKHALSLDEKNPDPRGLFHYGIALDLLASASEDEKLYEKAIDILSSVLEKIPDSQAVRHQLALAYFHAAELTGEVENHYRAIDLFESVVKQDREDEAAWCGLGCVLLNLSVQVHDPLHPELENELKTRAGSALLRSAELGNLEALYHLACLYSLCDQVEKSMEYLQKAYSAHALPRPEDLLDDEWLAKVRETEAFKTFYSSHWG